MHIVLWLVIVDLVIAMITYMTLWYSLSVYAKRLDVVDAAWGLGFIYVTALTLVLDGRYEIWQRFVLIFVSVWGLRLFMHIAKRLGSSNEDARYAEYRKKWGENFFTKSYVNIFMLQGLLVLLVATPALAAIMSPRKPIMWLAIAGFVVWALGIVFESIADYELHRFRTQKAGRGPSDILDKGLWRFSRHPNYFGEITAWCGAGIVAVSCGQWWGLIGPIVISYLIVKVSGIPSIEARHARDPKYKEYQQKTSVLIPRAPKA